jgi:hypothetical protein
MGLLAEDGMRSHHRCDVLWPVRSMIPVRGAEGVWLSSSFVERKQIPGWANDQKHGLWRQRATATWRTQA